MGSEGPAGVSGRPEDFAADRSRRLELDLAPVLRVARLTGDPVELDRHDTQHVPPVGFVLEDLSEFGLSRFPRKEEVERLVERLRAREGVDLH